MASNDQDTLLEAFEQVAGELGGSGSQSEPGVINVSAEAGSMAYSSPTTDPVYYYGSSGSGGSGGSSILSIATSIFGSGLGILPLVGGLMDLFGGGSSEPPPLEKYIMPDQLYFTGDDSGGSIQDADYNQYGMPRLYSDATSGTTSQSGSLSLSTNGSGGTGSPVNVTIQALDSQSFLDRSSDIAQAVRQAMLTSSSINDVVNNDL